MTEINTYINENCILELEDFLTIFFSLKFIKRNLFQNAAQTVRLDGDIICQQNEIRPWLAEGGSGSVEDVRSVCSCTAFDPFHIKAKRRLKKAAKAARKRRGTLETEDTLGGTRCSTTMKWYSTDSLHTNTQRSPVAVQVHTYLLTYICLDILGKYIRRQVILNYVHKLCTYVHM